MELLILARLKERLLGAFSRINCHFGVPLVRQGLIKRIMFVLAVSYQLSAISCLAGEVKEPNVAGTFYPATQQELLVMVDALLRQAKLQEVKGDITALITPHAGYGYSGTVAASGYALIKAKPYRSVVILGTSHYYNLQGVSVYPGGAFRTPLGEVQVDTDFATALLSQDPDIQYVGKAFQKEHSVEVQIPFLQRTLTDFKVVPIVLGDCSLSTCQKLAELLKKAIGDRKDVLVVASTDMYHGYDYEEADVVDNLTLSYLKNMDAQGLYEGLREGRLQLCGGFGVVSVLFLAKASGNMKLVVLDQTNSANVTGKKVKGVWTVGYASCAITHEKEGVRGMLNHEQKKRLIEIARSSIETYLKARKNLELTESDALLTKQLGAFVTLHAYGQLRGCIGNITGSQPLYLTVRDMAVEAAVSDPRFQPVSAEELKDIEIEISVLSALERVDSPEKIEMGKHGVIVRRGFSSGVFLPQVATETGWSREEFLSNLCSHKAGLAQDAWKDKATELYIFTAEVFSEKDIL